LLGCLVVVDPLFVVGRLSIQRALQQLLHHFFDGRGVAHERIVQLGVVRAELLEVEADLVGVVSDGLSDIAELRVGEEEVDVLVQRVVLVYHISFIVVVIGFVFEVIRVSVFE
jgi:uncharacterized protein YgfB (UPF0149 family)